MPGLTEKANPQKKYDMLWMGVDVGSTTVKITVVDNETDQILWADYQRHETKQPEKLLEMLHQIKNDLPSTPYENYRVFITGSGGSGISKHIGAKSPCFMQHSSSLEHRSTGREAFAPK